MKPVRLHAGAKAEAEAAALYYESRQTGLGFDFLAEVEITLGRIAACPERWPRAGYGTRRISTARFPYTLARRSRNQIVLVLGQSLPKYDRIIDSRIIFLGALGGAAHASSRSSILPI